MQKYKDFLTCANKSEELGRNLGVFLRFLHKKNIRCHLERCPELAVKRLSMNCSDQFIVKVREIARECKKLLIRERPDVAFGCIQQE